MTTLRGNRRSYEMFSAILYILQARFEELFADYLFTTRKFPEYVLIHLESEGVMQM